MGGPFTTNAESSTSNWKGAMMDPSTRADLRKWLATNLENNILFRLEEALEHIYINQQPKASVPANDVPALYDFAAATLRDEPITYLEFGVASGKSMKQMIQRFGHADTRFYGFDSFQGLPEEWVQPWARKPKGSFSMRGRLPEINDSRVKLINGWFQNTLPSFLRTDWRREDDQDRVLVHFDADLWSSTTFILSTLWATLNEYYFIFDEFCGQEIIALYDFSRAFPVSIEYLCQTNVEGYPNRIFGRLKRTQMVVVE
jgi:hypothetical protein